MVELRYLDDYRDHDTPAMRKAAMDRAMADLNARYWRDVRNMMACFAGVMVLAGVGLAALLACLPPTPVH